MNMFFKLMGAPKVRPYIDYNSRVQILFKTCYFQNYRVIIKKHKKL